MSNKDDGLSQLVQDVIDGKAEKKELCNKIYKEVYALAYPVYQNEEKSMTQAKKALIEICKRIGDFNLERNIHKQVATIASAFFFTSVVSENAEELRNNAPTGEYEYTHIKDDEEFVTYMKQKAIAFRSPKSFDQQEESFRNLSEIEMSLTELYAYEMLSVDAIESVTDVDSSYISGWLAGIRSYVLGYETAGNADNNDMAAVADNDYNSLDESDYSDEEYDDSDYGYDENNNNDDYREREAVSSVYRKTGKRLKENAVTIFIKRLFPALTLPARMMVSWIAGGVIVIILIIILVVSVKAGKSNKKSASYEYQNMQYTTEQAATKNNKKNEAATASTEAGTEEQTTQKQTENVTQSTTGSSSNNTTNRTTANTSDDDSITGNTSSDNSGSTDNDTNGSGDTGSTDNGASGSGTTGGSTDNGTSGSSTTSGRSDRSATAGTTKTAASGISEIPEIFRIAASACTGPGHYIFQLYEWLCIQMERVPFHSIVAGRPEMWKIGVFYVALGIRYVWSVGEARDNLERKGIFLFPKEWNAPGKNSVFIAVAVVFLVVQPVHGFQSWFLDVGQGDGVFLRTRDEAILSDCGSSQDKKIGKNVLGPFLKSQGIRTLDCNLVRHTDADHTNGI